MVEWNVLNFIDYSLSLSGRIDNGTLYGSGILYTEVVNVIIENWTESDRFYYGLFYIYVYLYWTNVLNPHGNTNK